MESRQGYGLPKILDPKKFEKLVRDCASKKYNKIFGLYGRTGQKQHGIDIYANDDFQEVIQCKNYTTNDIKALKDAINKDFESAYNYFYKEKGWQFERFIVATAIDKDKKIDDIIIEHNQQNDIKIEFWFWEDIQDMEFKDNELLITYHRNFVIDLNELKLVHTDNKAYADSFCETLFLHKHQSESKVNLRNLFVMPRYTEYRNDTPKTNLKEKIIDFLNGDKQFLFIEGDAGCGKSTLVSWLNYNEMKAYDDETKMNIFDNRTVITIRLRDLDRKIIHSNRSLIDSILKRMNLDSCENMEERFSKAVMILDGFDELCMIEGITNYNELIEELEEISSNEYKYIITSRPHYIKSGIRLNSYKRITLQHFDKSKRKEWITHYTSSDYCGQTLDSDIENYIVNISNDTDSVICDTPMTLYMLAAKNTSIELTKNSWELYHHIFYNELSDTEYNKMFGRKHRHNVYKYKDIFYRITEEIAYKMYFTNNNQFYVSSDELKEIITALIGNNKQLQSIDYLIEQCYALCNYWKETGDGAVEFYHNNIRDFFLCEKIYRELNKIYNHRDLSEEGKIDKIIKFFLQFKKAPLQDMVCKFIILRAEKDVNNPNSFVCQEKTRHLLPYFFEKMLTDGKLYDNLNENKHIQAIVNILSCAAQVYRHIYEPILTETKEKYVKWWNDVFNINKNSDIIKYLFKNIFNHEFMNEQRFGKISNRADLSGADLSDTDLRDADLSYTDLRGADLSYTDLRGAILISADLISADLSGAALCGAVLIVADLSGAKLRYANLNGANLNGAKLIGAKLIGAELIGAELENANLSGADLSGADLRYATLPDGFNGEIQEEQVQHLKEMNIEGLVI